MIEFYSIDVLNSSYFIRVGNLIVISDNGKILKSSYDCYEGIRCHLCDIKGTNECKVLIRNNSYVTPCELLDEVGVSCLKYVGSISLILSSKIKVSSNSRFDKLMNNYERLVSLLEEMNGYVEDNSKK